MLVKIFILSSEALYKVGEMNEQIQGWIDSLGTSYEITGKTVHVTAGIGIVVTVWADKISQSDYL